jgi:hypothetical protein
MYGLYLYANQSIEVALTAVQKNFSAIYQKAERMEELYDARSEDELLADHCIAFEDWAPIKGSDGWYRPKLLIRHLLQQKPDAAKTAWITNFSHRLSDTFKFAHEILSIRDSDKSIPLGELTALGRTAGFWPLMVKCWKHDIGPDKKDFNRAVRAMESFTFRSIFGGKNSNRGDSELRRLARDFSGDFDALVARLRQMQNEAGIVENLATNLNTARMYEWWVRPVTYLLWRYENHLRQQTGWQVPRLSWKTIIEPANHAVKYQRDHIEPQDPNNPNLARLVTWTEGDQPKEFREVCLHRLGNLVLDTFGLGGAKGNMKFEDRIPLYQNGTLRSQNELVGRFATKDNGNYIWDIVAIQKRQKVLSDYATNKIGEE